MTPAISDLTSMTPPSSLVVHAADSAGVATDETTLGARGRHVVTQMSERCQGFGLLASATHRYGVQCRYKSR